MLLEETVENLPPSLPFAVLRFKEGARDGPKDGVEVPSDEEAVGAGTSF